MAKTDRSNLGFLGETFQFRLAHELLSNKQFFEELSPVIDQNMFTNPYLKVIVGVTKNYFEKNGQVPSFDTVEIELRNMIHSEADMEVHLEMLKTVKGTMPEDAENTRDLAMRFFRQQNIIKTANEILRIAGNGDISKYDNCVELLNEAMAKGIHNDFGEGVFDHLEDTLAEDYRQTIPTGIDKIDEALEGGIGKGELGVIIAPSGIGKTSLTTAMASHAAVSGKKVLQIVFEDSVKQIQRKHIGKISGVESKDLSKPENLEHVRAVVKKYQEETELMDNLRIVRFPSGEKTARWIKRYIKKLSNSGFKPDLVIVDYFECLAHESDGTTTNEFELEGKTMRIFEAMVQELDIAMWIPSQGTKDSINLDLVTMDKIGGSVKKAQIAHIILSVARTVDDIANNRATIAILKNRAGQSGRILANVGFNNGTCTIDTSCADDMESFAVRNERKAQEKDELHARIVKEIHEKNEAKAASKAS